MRKTETIHTYVCDRCGESVQNWWDLRTLYVYAGPDKHVSVGDYCASCISYMELPEQALPS